MENGLEGHNSGNRVKSWSGMYRSQGGRCGGSAEAEGPPRKSVVSRCTLETDLAVCVN